MYDNLYKGAGLVLCGARARLAGRKVPPPAGFEQIEQRAR